MAWSYGEDEKILYLRNGIRLKGQFFIETVDKFIIELKRAFTKSGNLFSYSFNTIPSSANKTGTKHTAGTSDERLQVKQRYWTYAPEMQMNTATPRLWIFASIVVFFQKKGRYVFGYLTWYQIGRNYQTQVVFVIKLSKRSTSPNYAWRFLLMCLLVNNLISSTHKDVGFSRLQGHPIWCNRKASG